MLEEKIPPQMIDDIIAFLSVTDLFKKMKRESLIELVHSMTLVFLEGGETIIHQGDYDSSLYILMQGRLRVFVKTDSNGSDTPKLTSVGEISVGEIVGEIALLIGSPRTSTVRSIRSSLLIKLNKENFQEFKQKHPEEVNEIAITAIKRLVSNKRQTESGEKIITIAILPAGDSDHRSFAHRFVEELNKIDSTLLVNSKLCDQYFGKEIAQTTTESDENILINGWLNSLEKKHRYIVYETDSEMSPWTERCLKQADRILLVAQDFKNPLCNSIENYLYSLLPENLVYNEIVLVHSDNATKIKGTLEWLKQRRTNGFHHLRMGIEADWAKLIRFLRGKALGVVLSGGSAKTLIHIGILKALDELNIPIDFIAGNSMGAVIAAAYTVFGLSGPTDVARDTADRYYQEYTFPYIALLSGKIVTQLMKHWFGEIEIEDLWIRFFCVSTNLTTEQLHIHDKGLLWRALRATTALPAFFPPIYEENGDELVDGGVINNLPVDVMRKLMSGGKILAINCNALRDTKKTIPIEKSWVSGWKLLFKRLNFFAKDHTKYNDIFSILYRSTNLGSNNYEKLMEKQADYLILCDSRKFDFWDFKTVDRSIAEGYKIGMDELPKLNIPH